MAEGEKWPTPEQQAAAVSAARQHADLIRKFQADWKEVGDGPFVGEAGALTALALLKVNGKCFAKDLLEGYCFSYPGSFKIYEAQSDAVSDDRIEGKVVLPVTDHGLRDHMGTRLDADLVCTLHVSPFASGGCPECSGILRPGKVPGGPGWICDCGYHTNSTTEKKEKKS